MFSREKLSMWVQTQKPSNHRRVQKVWQITYVTTSLTDLEAELQYQHSYYACPSLSQTNVVFIFKQNLVFVQKNYNTDWNINALSKKNEFD
jgi:hypothetical protein